MSDASRTHGNGGETSLLAADAPASGHAKPAETAKPTETEATLVVVADAPEEVADAVAALTELEGYSLLAVPDESIRDRYYDTPDGLLGSTGSNLRVREVNGRRLLTIKGPPRVGEGGLVSRQEQPWPEPAWAMLRAGLGDVIAVPSSQPASDPVGALESLGLVLLQARTTERRVRAALPPAGGRARVAELAVDAVVFDLDGRPGRHFEVEIEAKSEAAEAAVATLAASLERRFGPSLRPWPLGKLATGMALASLIRLGGSEAVLTSDGHVRASAYDAIASREGSA